MFELLFCLMSGLVRQMSCVVFFFDRLLTNLGLIVSKWTWTPFHYPLISTQSININACKLQ
jgi:hypothetical protein